MRRHQRSLVELASAVPADDEVLAIGRAMTSLVVVGRQRLYRKAPRGTVAIPYSGISEYESWHDAHRLGLRLHHAPIDPRSYVLPWWRPWDRHKQGRYWIETTLTFSREETDAATALSERLAAHRVEGREIPSPVARRPQVRELLRRID